MQPSLPNKNFTAQTVPLAPGVRALPVIHGSVECTALIRDIFLHSPPAMVAVELPAVLTDAVFSAIAHVDQIPVITIPDSEPAPTHLILEPLEPLVEAVRSATELNVPCRLIDPFFALPQIWVPESFPDTYVLNTINPAELYEIYLNSRSGEGDGGFATLVRIFDLRRELFMAEHIRQLAKFIGGREELRENLLVVCGISHLPELQSLCSLEDDEFTRRKSEILNDTEIFPSILDRLEGGGRNTPSAADGAENEEEPLEALLNRLSREEENRAAIRWEITVLSRESPEVLEQPGYFNTAWNLARRNPAAVAKFNRIALLRSAYRDAVDRYERESGELVPPQQEKLFFRFARNWSIVEKKLLPDSYRMVLAARGFGGDNFARIMYELLNFLIPLHGPAFPEKKLTLDDLHLSSRLIRFRLKLRIKRRVPPPKILRRFKREKYPGQWREAWTGQGICSYPPEDITIEDFGRYLQKKARSLMQGTEARTVPFTSSLLDGIDYRETVRNLHLGKIFVKDIATRGIEAGGVVVIFSEDYAEHAWQVVWWGEHEQESDMAFYATPPGGEMAGPGITRCRYGGFLLTYPPGRLHDIWNDDFYRDFPNPADRLLAAALEYNEKNAVVHLSDIPPAPRLFQLAGRMGQKIIHIPLSTINPILQGRIRRFHVLDSKERRDEADDYIW